MEAPLVLIVIVLLGTFAQTVSGFGMGLIIMPVISPVLGLSITRPLIAMIAVMVQIAMMIRSRHALSFRTIGVMSLVGFIGIPIGTRLVTVRWFSEELLLTLLAVLTIGYALYVLFTPMLPELKTDRTMPLFAFVSGILSGAYNTGGPPIMIYANARRWTAAQVRSNLQGFFMLKGLVLTVDHAIQGNYTPAVWANVGWSLPAIAVGLAAGFALYGRINEVRFQQIVLWLLVAVGSKILFDIYL